MGVFKLVEPSPVKVSIIALPMPPRKVTEFVPLPVQPPQVKTPDVENVTGSAFVIEVASATVVQNSAAINIAFMILTIVFSFPDSKGRSPGHL